MFDFFTAFGSYVVVFFVIFFVAAAKKNSRNKKSAQNSRPPVARPVQPQEAKTVRAQTGKAQSAASLSGHYSSQKISLLSSTMEDRKHDWLAKQLAEERAILRRGIQSDIGAVHDLSCDARKLKIEHEIIHSEINRNNTPYS